MTFTDVDDTTTFEKFCRLQLDGKSEQLMAEYLQTYPLRAEEVEILEKFEFPETETHLRKGQDSIVGKLSKGYPQIPQFQISPDYKNHIENLPIYPFKEEILNTIEKVSYFQTLSVFHGKIEFGKLKLLNYSKIQSII